MRLVADTGAILSLACSGYFNLILDSNEIIITKSVANELQEFAKYNDILGLKAKEILVKKLTVKNPNKSMLINLEQTESEVFALAKEEKCLALTDDAHAARVVYEKLKFDTKPSFYLLLLLYKKKKISKDDLIKDVQLIIDNRNWLGGALWEYAISIIEHL
ncbi:MAG: hypothetical protein HY363_06095 [Candidatus Aenigmarchaeota archaeon]|nr:hypothetical protein [Candidatus Aenigmarchaeota archaeon]